MFQSLIQGINEKELIRKKREFQVRGIKLRTHRRADRLIYTLHGPIHYNWTVLIPDGPESKSALLHLMYKQKHFLFGASFLDSGVCSGIQSVSPTL